MLHKVVVWWWLRVSTQDHVQKGYLTIFIQFLAVRGQGSSTAMSFVVWYNPFILKGEDTGLWQTKHSPHHLLDHCTTAGFEDLLALTQGSFNTLLPIVSHRVHNYRKPSVEIPSETSFGCGHWLFRHYSIFRITSSAREDGDIVGEIISDTPIERPT